ncbi:MAG: PTS sugar transporter subunit IIB [Erysipelotrichaceae bacterium]|jgi:PTS system mannose-specific IIB component|nr:PTS sugar transporter subunit IIB [Erysipelotrichaceae bacterium]
MIAVMRSDDRLIHGQVQTRIIPLNGIKRVITIDKINASNPMLKRIYEMAAPHGVECTVVDFDEGVALIKEAMNDDVRTLILARVPSVFADLYRAVDGLPMYLNIATVPAVVGEVQVKLEDHCYLNEKELNAVKEMGNNGVDVVIQQHPSSPAISWNSIKGKY